jgi:hypothetical protein
MNDAGWLVPNCSPSTVLPVLRPIAFGHDPVTVLRAVLGGQSLMFAAARQSSAETAKCLSVKVLAY